MDSLAFETLLRFVNMKCIRVTVNPTVSAAACC